MLHENHYAYTTAPRSAQHITTSSHIIQFEKKSNKETKTEF